MRGLVHPRLKFSISLLFLLTACGEGASNFSSSTPTADRLPSVADAIAEKSESSNAIPSESSQSVEAFMPETIEAPIESNAAQAENVNEAEAEAENETPPAETIVELDPPQAEDSLAGSEQDSMPVADNAESSEEIAQNETEFSVVVGEQNDDGVTIINDSTNTVQPISESDIASCMNYFGGEGEIKVYGNENSLMLGSQDILAVRIAGNQNTVTIDIKPTLTSNNAPTPSILGMCFFLSGNKARAKVSLENINLSKLWTELFGNSAQTTIHVGENASIGTFDLLTNGNGTNLHIQGPGEYQCDPNKAYVSCQ